MTIHTILNFLIGWLLPIVACIIGLGMTALEHARHMAEIDAGLWTVEEED